MARPRGRFDVVGAGERVAAFWQAMGSNDWAAVAARHLTPDFVLTYPQTGEIIEGQEGFARLNGAFPGQGGWRFEMVSLVAEATRAVSDMRVTHDTLGFAARAMTFHDVAGGLIRRQTEFWPEPYPVPEWRAGMFPRGPGMAI